MRNKNAKIGEGDRAELELLFQKMATSKALLTAFIDDILTPAEIHELVARVQIVKQLSQGVPQRDVARNLHVSLQTVSRGARTLENSAGGFKTIRSKNWWRPRSKKANAA